MYFLNTRLVVHVIFITQFGSDAMLACYIVFAIRECTEYFERYYA